MSSARVLILFVRLFFLSSSEEPSELLSTVALSSSGPNVASFFESNEIFPS
jgi:hypothetical protein